jgi:integrase/recombinase XerC
MPPRHGDLIDAYLAHLARIRRARKTIITYADVLWPAHRSLPEGLPMALPHEIEAWLATPGWTAGTQRLRTVVIRGFFRWCVEWQHLDRDPSERIVAPDLPWRPPRAASDEQVAAILADAPDPVWTWSVLASRAGLRAVEVARLRREDITQQHVIVIGKGNKMRRIPTHRDVWNAVADLPPGHIVERRPGDQDEEVASRISSRAWRTYRSIGVRTSIHRLRGWLGHTLLHAGHDLSTVQDWLGHSSPLTTRRYATPSEEMMRAALASLPDIGVEAGGGRPAGPRRRSRSGVAGRGPNERGWPPPAPPPGPDTAHGAPSANPR